MKFRNRYLACLILFSLVIGALAGCSLFQTLGFVAPDTPSGLSVGNATATSLDISWNSSVGATSYQVFRATSSSGPWATQAYNNTATGFTDTGLSSGTTYYYVVESKNSAGNSGVSGVVSGTTTNTTPSTPAPSTPMNLAAGSASVSSLTLTWSASTGATSYQLYRAASTDGPWTNKVYDGSATSFTDTGLSSGTTYYYVVQATNAAGSSPLSTSAYGTTTPSSNANLASAEIIDSAETSYPLTPTFTPTSYDYTTPTLYIAGVPYKIVLTLEDSKATITSVQEIWQGNPDTYVVDTGDGTGTYTLQLLYYYTQITILVTAQDGVTTQTYTITAQVDWEG